MEMNAERLIKSLEWSNLDKTVLEKLDLSKPIIESIKELTISQLDIQTDSAELQTALLKTPEITRVLTLLYFDVKARHVVAERELEEWKSSILVEIAENDNQSRMYKNAEAREARIVTDKGYKDRRMAVDELNWLMLKIEQLKWSYTTFDSNLRAVAELRIKEMRLG